MTFVSGLDHFNLLNIQRRNITNIKHVLPAPMLETSAPVASRRRHSAQVMCTCLADQQSSRPHHCVPQWLSSNGRCGHPSNHNTAPHCLMSAQERWTRPSAIDSFVPVHPSRCSPFHRPSRCTQYIHERLLLIAFIGTFCNPSHFLGV